MAFPIDSQDPTDDQDPPDDQPAAPAKPTRLFSADEFGSVIRKLYPTLADATPDNRKLTIAILRTHPELRSHVIDPEGGMEGRPEIPQLPQYRGPGAPPSPVPYEGDQTPMVRRASAKGGPGNVQTTVGEMHAGVRAQEEGVGGAAGQLFASPVTGATRVVGGVQQVWNGQTWEQRAQGAANVIGGAMETALPLMPGALFEAPLAVGTGLLAGTGAAAGVNAAGEALGAPSGYTHLASEIAGLVGGVAAGEGAGALRDRFTAARSMRANAPIYDQMGVEHQNLITDQAREHALAEGGMQADFKAGNEMLDENQSLFNVLQYKDRQFQDQEIDKLSLGLAENYRLNTLAAKMKADQASHQSPFDTLDAFGEGAGEQPPLALPAAPEPAGLLGPGSPARFLAEASDQEYPGRLEGADPNAVDVTDPTKLDPRQIATSEQPPPPLVQSLGEQLASGLEQVREPVKGQRPPEALQPRPTEPTRIKMADRMEFKATVRDVAKDMVGEMDYMPHQKGRSFSDEQGMTYTPPVAGSEWYHRVVGKMSNPPTRTYIGELMRAYKDSDGKLTGSELPNEVVAAGQKALEMKTPGGFRRAYDEWSKDIDQAVKGRANAKMGYERVARERAAEDAARAVETRPAEAITPTAEFLAHGPDGPLYNIRGGPHDRSTVSAGKLEAMGIDVPETPADTGERLNGQQIRQLAQERASRDANAQPPEGISPDEDTLAADEAYKSQAQALAESHESFSSLSDFFQKMKGEAGHLILNVAPSNKRGLKEWLARHADEYGSEDWHQKATEALEEGDHQVAYRIAAMASARQMAAAGARGAEEREHQQVSMSPEEIKLQKETPEYKKRFAQLKKDLGGEVPKGIDINSAGMMTFGPPEKNLKAAATDLLLGKNFAADVIAAADPTKIIRIEGNQDPEMRINRQIAEQLVKSMPDEIIEPLQELLKIPDRAEFAKHFARTVSSWGKGLRMLKDWQDEHWDDFYHVLKVGGGSGEAEGAVVGLSDIKTPNGFVQWLHTTATAEDLDAVGYKLPKNIKEGTKEAETFAKTWFKQREAREARRTAAAKTIADLAQDGSAFDKAVLAGALEPAGTKSRGTTDALENTSRAFVISQPVTLIRNLWTQAARYSVGVLDDALASGYSMLALDPKEATRYADRALQTAKAVATPGNVSAKMLKTPWIDSLESTYDFMGDSVVGLKPEDMRKTIALMDQFPRRASTYTGGLALETAGDAKPTSRIPGVNQLIQPEVRNFVTVLGRTQEMAFRGAVFDSSVRAQLRDMGLDPNVELAGDPTKLIGKLGEKKMDQIIGGAVASALDYTFAAKPYPGSIPSAILNVFSNIPVFSAMLRMGFPFPRFNWVSAPRWLYDHSPAALMDIPMAVWGSVSSEGAPFKGRLYRGIEGQKIQDQVIPHLTAKIGETEFNNATAKQEFVRNKVDAREAAKSFKAAEKKAEKMGMLPEIHDEMQFAAASMQNRIASAQKAKASYDEGVTTLRELKKQQRNAEEKLLRIKEIGAPNPTEYFSRMTTGAMMLGAAYMMRSSDGAKDTKWYEYNVEAPGFGKHTLDLRSFAPMVQFLLPADIMHSVQTETNWDGVHKYLADHPGDWENALRKHYHGRYTGTGITAEAATAFLSIAPAAGAGASILDYITGRGGVNKQGVVQTAMSATLGFVGQFLGRFTTPVRPLKDLAGQFDPEEAKARIPQESSDQTHHAQELYGPALANIPYASEAIPEKKSPLTGEPIATVNPMARAFAGLSEHDKNRFETEIAKTGIEYSKMVPRQTGDREFDNAVAEAYHAGLVKYANKLLDHPKYDQLTPELKRDVLGSAFGGLKQYALAEAGKKLGLDSKQTHAKTVSPGAQQKIDRWKGYLDELRTETERDHPTPVEEGQPQARAGENAPPAGYPSADAQLGSQRVNDSLASFDARPPAGL